MCSLSSEDCFQNSFSLSKNNMSNVTSRNAENNSDTDNSDSSYMEFKDKCEVKSWRPIDTEMWDAPEKQEESDWGNDASIFENITPTARTQLEVFYMRTPRKSLLSFNLHRGAFRNYWKRNKLIRIARTWKMTWKKGSWKRLRVRNWNPTTKEEIHSLPEVQHYRSSDLLIGVLVVSELITNTKFKKLTE